MRLAIDAGNSRTKWALFDTADVMQSHGVMLNSELDSELISTSAAWRDCQYAVASNVAGVEVGGSIAKVLAQQSIRLHWVKSSSSAYGLSNQYLQAEKLGTDRWAALVAAWRQDKTPCLVVNAGTALTIDAIGSENADEGMFLGGMIMPGLQLMQTSLVQRTAGIARQHGVWQDFPQNTGDALYSGALIAMTGAVQQMMKILQRHQAQYHQATLNRCMITGGDASLLAAHLQRQAEQTPFINYEIAEHLVLQGLLLLDRYD